MVYLNKGVLFKICDQNLTRSRSTQVWIFPAENTGKFHLVAWTCKPIPFSESWSLEGPGRLERRTLNCEVCWSFAEENDHNAKNHNWPSAFPDVEPSVSINFPRLASSPGLALSAARNTQAEGAKVGLSCPVSTQHISYVEASSTDKSRAVVLAVLEGTTYLQYQNKKFQETEGHRDPRERNPSLPHSS